MGSTPGRSRRWRWLSLFGATALAVTVGGALAGPASAADTNVDFATHCIPPAIAGLPPIDGTTTANVSVDNTSPKVGDTVTVTYTVVTAAASNPTDLALPADIMTPTGKVTLGGAQTGDVTVAGPKKNPPVPGKAAFPSFSMTGTFTVTKAGQITLSPGDYNIHTSYIMELDTPCTVTNPPAPVSGTITATDGTPANTRAISLSAASGDPGASVTVSGTDFTPGAAVTLAGRAGDTQTADTATVTADSQGSFSGSLVVNDKTTTGIVAYEGGSWNADKGAGPAAYVVNDNTPIPDGSQKLTTTVKAGTLSMSQAGDSVALSTVDFGQGGASTGTLQTVTVKDFRGGPAGWSLTGKVTDFTGPGAKIDAGRLSWTPACVTTAGSPSTCKAGSAGTVGTSGATLASAPDATLTGGEFTVDAGLSLDVPAFTPPGSYSGVLTLTLT
ncbi:beta-xylosidase [Streptomyces pluripotens]|uniref:Beta-xylosidase n=1 Tax=Streptomyces pluripotens TaxID=1355015 RepID=A0A221NY19_9ACTN|nr:MULTISPECIES: beta-xylosidase [Streptomyces]ARP70145.1 beta-xylosidase [Streptomyces pluripotens]ASN24405.1 beta-xylosidase [Streptomyces pluripotens]KIE25191.1 beta-xylosidase [Streptomyces sp. MUSC 125]MCH0559136.1 beta-xylosidase [Streptomyces sp. MUM 16J]